MALFTYSDEIFIDPAISGDSGDGSFGDPWSNFTTMLATEVMSAAGGKRINVKFGVAVVEVADLDWTTTFFASNTPGVIGNPLVIQGYTTNAGDRGIGEWNGDGLYEFLVITTIDAIFLIDLHLHNSGSALIFHGDDWCGAANCEFDNSSASSPAMRYDNSARIIGCHFHDGVSLGVDSMAHVVKNKFIDDKTNQSFISRAIFNGDDGAAFIANKIWLDTVGIDGIQYNNGALVMNNAVFQNAAGTGGAIVPQNSTSQHSTALLNNLVEGFSGAGGKGVECVLTRHHLWVDGNYVSDCTNEYVNVDRSLIGDSDNEAVADTSPFVDGPNKDLSPVNTGNIKEGSLPATIGEAVTS